MIFEAVDFITKELNNYIKLKTSVSDEKVILSNIVNQDGSLAFNDDNKITASVVNIHEERIITASQNANNRHSSNANPPICLNLYILFSSHFNAGLKSEALKFISIIIGFFQANRVFDSASYPELDDSIDKLIFEMHNLDFQEQNLLWGSLGAKYTPSVLYKARTLIVDEGMVKTDLKEIEQPILPNILSK